MSFNKVFLAGTVLGDPEFSMDADHGDSLNIKLHINRKDIGKTEVITVCIFNEELLNKALEEIKDGDYMVVTNGRLISTNYIKVSSIICPICQNVDYKQTQAEKTEIEVYNYQLMKNIDKDLAIGINKIFLRGNVCSALNFRPGANNGKDYIKYKLAVNRVGKNRIDKPADFPFIVSFNKEATNAQKYLKQGSEIFLEGAIQEREIAQKNNYNCQNCGNESTPKSKSIVREVITAKVEYINVNKDEDDSSEETE